MEKIVSSRKVRGFVTIATGDESYYKQAFNLLRSYRLFNHHLPFAIVCDRQNKYTADFDDVFLLGNAQKNYLDKLSLLLDAPYDECVFIESDCIIYRNIEAFFDLLSTATDFSCFGWNNGELSTWFSDPAEPISRFGEKIAAIPIFNPGYFYIRQSTVCKKMYQDALEIADWIAENQIQGGKISLICKGTLRDDPLFSLSMRLNDCVCAAKPSVGKCIFLPRVKKLKIISLLKGELDVVQEREYTRCNLLHFSSRRSREEGLYLQQTTVLKMIYHRAPRVLIRLIASKPVYYILHFYRRCKFAVIHRLAK